MRFLAIFFLFFATSIFSNIQAQDLLTNDRGPKEDGNIEEQIDFLVKESNNYKQYKVIPKDKMQKLKANILDSLASVRGILRDTKSTLSEKNNSIASLNSRLTELQSLSLIHI